MSTAEDAIARAKRAYRAGQRAEARQILLNLLQHDAHHEAAWLLLSALVETPAEQRTCLENVLTLNPTHEAARKGLEAIERKLNRHAGPSRLAPADDPWADVSGGDFARHDPDAPVTSVEWSRDEGAAVYGSGKQITLPTGQEYDEWVRSLRISTDAPADEAKVPPFVAEDLGPFGDTAFMVDTHPFAGDPAFDALSGNSAPFFQADDEMPVEYPGSPGPSQGGRVWGADPAPRQPDPDHAPRRTRHEFSFEPDDEDELPAAPLPSASPVRPAAAPAPVRAAAAHEPEASGPDVFFKYIPPEITAPSGGSGRRTVALAAGVVVLIAANIAALAALLGAV